jgi:hypothetical protein
MVVYRRESRYLQNNLKNPTLTKLPKEPYSTKLANPNPRKLLSTHVPQSLFKPIKLKKPLHRSLREDCILQESIARLYLVGKAIDQIKLPEVLFKQDMKQGIGFNY